MSASPRPRFSVVICTVDRCESLARTLESLTQLDTPELEVVVVAGPSTDATHALLERWRGRIKVVTCDVRNLSISRNLGIAAAAGELIAFIDDDAYPEPDWLECLGAAFADPEVAAAGGPTVGHTGSGFQAFYSFADRLGDAWVTWGPDGTNPTAILNRPGSRVFVYPIGTNAAFRRSALVQIGGFDEEFEYYLEETDAAVRIIDRGWVVAALDQGFVFHKFLPSDIRNSLRALRNRFPVLKNRVYFALRHGLEHYSFADIVRNLNAFFDAQRAEVLMHLEHGLLDPADVTRFEVDVHAASEAGFAHWRDGPRLRPPEWFDEGRQPFRPFPTRPCDGRRLHLCFLSQEHPPGPVNGIGRIVGALARALADAGHVVRVLTDGAPTATHDLVDLEDGVWVHRLAPRHHERPADVAVSQRIWDRTATARDALRAIDERRPIDLVHAPNWDVEGFAALRDGGLPVAVATYTPIGVVRALDRGLADDPAVPALIDADRWCYQHADVLVASSTAVLDAIELAYDLALDRSKVAVVPLGLPDDAPGATARGATTTAEPHVLFVGRLEHRKGVDSLLAAVPEVLSRVPGARFTIVGDDGIPAPGGGTFRARFEAEAAADVQAHVTFTGRLSDEDRSALLDACDVFVAPSRFESFGLVLLEAMMRAKPVVAGSTEAMRAIVEGGAGLVVDPDSPSQVAQAIVQLCESPSLRQVVGNAGRDRFVERYRAETMAAAYVEATRAWTTSRLPL